MYDTKEIIKCPACGTKMKKVYIERKRFNLDICENCGGILFDNQEFKHFDEQHESISEILRTLENKNLVKQDESKTRICPVCLAPMVKNYASVLNEVEVDECYSCGAKFLDGGELEKIRKQYETEEDRVKSFNETFLSKFGDKINNVSAKEEDRKLEIEKILETYEKEL